MDNSVEKKHKYEELLKDASMAYLAQQYQRALGIYNEVLPVATELKKNKIVIAAIKYLICRCLLETNNLDNLAEVVMTLQYMDQTIKNLFPAIYTLLAKAHCKLFRYDKALEAVKEGDAIYALDSELLKIYIPGTHVVIEQSKNEQSWIHVKEECSVWHKPDAICCMTDCINITKPYVTANRNIFIINPAFNGMVIATCNNKTDPCSLTFHQACWKHKKDELFPIQKVSDKEIIGSKCFTPSCMNEDVPCTISSIEIIDKSGEVKAFIKDSTPTAWSINKSATPKGAIKKIKVCTVNKVESSVTPAKQQTVLKPIDRRDGYDENQILAIKDYSRTIYFLDDPPSIAAEKQFVFSLFHDYIQNNLVRVCDVYSTFADINENLSIKNMDILSFLLETNKIEVLDNRNPMPSYLETQQFQEMFSETANSTAHSQNKLKDIDDVYDQLVNDADDDDDDVYEQCISSCDNNNAQGPIKPEYSFSNSNLSNPNYEGGGDAPSQMKYSVDNTFQYSNYNRPIEETLHINHYINQLESKMEKMMDEKNNLKEELKKKDNIIKDMQKENEVAKEKFETCESLCKIIDDFKQKYKVIQDQNITFKEEIINLIKEKKDLEVKLMNSSNPEIKKTEFMKAFQNEYKILQDCINAEWEKKTEELKKSFEDQSDLKISVFHKYLDCQYSSNKHLLNGYLDKCTIALAVFNKINDWMNEAISFKNFIDTADWLSKLHTIQTIATSQQDKYSNLVEELQSGAVDKINLDDLNIQLPELPVVSEDEISNAAKNALDALYRQLQERLHKQILLTRQMQTAMQNGNSLYPQFCPFPMMPPQINPSLFVRPQHMQNSMQSVPNYEPHGMQMPTVPPGFKPQVQQKVATITAAPSEIKSQSIDQTPVCSSSSNEINASAKDNDIKKQNKIESNQTTHEKNSKTALRVNDNYDDISIKVAKMKEAFKAVVMNVKEKRAAESSSDDEQASNITATTATVITARQVANCSVKSTGKKSAELVEVDNIRDDRSDITTVIVQKEPVKAKKKIVLEQLCKMMLKKYPGAMEVDILEIIEEVRKKHNNSLSGLPVSQIMRESEEYFLNSQRLHLLRYFLNDNNSETSQTDTSSKVSSTSYQSALKDVISPASSCNSLNMQTSLPPSPKQCWKTVTSEETQWSTGNDVNDLGCTICMAPIDKILSYTLNCGHSFHNQCITLWLKSDRSCPNCRLMITNDVEFPPLCA